MLLLMKRVLWVIVSLLGEWRQPYGVTRRFPFIQLDDRKIEAKALDLYPIKQSTQCKVNFLPQYLITTLHRTVPPYFLTYAARSCLYFIYPSFLVQAGSASSIYTIRTFRVHFSSSNVNSLLDDSFTVTRVISTALLLP
ncbi:hypothetical protein CPC08DRAFT_118964 [Agrocybe pediades]|nr:hypothetical protein CPC08DRAFT_118964 [Agrocybe pediades]